MTPLTREWVDKAEGDFATAQRETRARKQPNHDAACFHCQQCAEKYLKARLQEASVAFPPTHNLTNLLNLLLPVEPTFSLLRSALQALTLYAVQYRYPGTQANRAEARAALALCRTVRDAVRTSLGLS